MAINETYNVASGGSLKAGFSGAPAYPAENSAFIGAPITGTTPLAVTFTNQSTGNITGYLWDFGDGQTSTSANPTHVYNTVGSFDVTLTVTGPRGSNVYTRTGYVTATEATLTWSVPDTATEGVAITGTITNSGAASGAWSINVPIGWTVTPSSGSSVVSGSPISVSITPIAGTEALTLTCSGATIIGNPQTVVASAPSASLTVGAQITSLTVKNLSGSGARPYSATVLLNPGQVPAGTYISNSAGTQVATIGSTYSDGSAAWAIISGTASADGSVAIHTATGTPPANLTTSTITSQVTSVSVAFGSPYGTADITDFSTPERIWWANPGTICARYRVPAPTPGSTALEAVIDIQAWSDRALVEVVVENCKMITASPTKPAAANYTAAVVSVNGNVIATVNGNSGPEGNHAAFRSWYVKGWVGGDPGLQVTQIHTDLQRNPLLFKCDQVSTFDMANYAGDVYTPWTAGRHRAINMGGTGDHDSIGTIPKWEAHALQSGDYRAWKATETSALAVLGFNVNYRDTTTGLVPTFAAIGTRAIAAGTWPVQWPGGGAGTMEWEVAHSPAAGLMAFIGRPSPVFIEIAQKVAVWNGTWSADATPNWTAGMFGYWYQVRGRAWGVRSLAHATFVTPDTLAWKSSARTSIRQNVDYFALWPADGRYTLNAMCDGSPSGPVDHQTGTAGFQQPLFEHHYFTVEMCKLADAQLANIGADQTAVEAVADWAALQPVRYVNEQPNGGWRYISYDVRLGSVNNSLTLATTYADWGAARAAELSGNPTAVDGPFYSHGGTPSDYTTGWTSEGTAPGGYYPAYFWTALISAYERGVAGADTALQTVLDNVTNLNTYRSGFGLDPRWGSWPKNYVSLGWDNGAGTGSIVGNLWTPGTGPSSKVNAASWTTLQVGRDGSNNLRAYRIAGTRLDSLDASLKATMLATYGAAWEDVGVSRWGGVTDAWVGAVLDDRSGREKVHIGPGGGHAASGNNGVYTCDLRKMQWGITSLPTPPTLVTANDVYPAGYQGDTNYPRYSGPYASPYTGVWMDEVFDPANPTDPIKSSRKPTSRHTYGMQCLRYDEGTQGTLYMLCRRAWKMDLATGVWSTPININGAADGAWVPAENGFAWWDEVRNRAYLMATALSLAPDSRSCWWDGATGWGIDGPFPSGGYPSASSACEKVGRTIHTMLYQHDNLPGEPPSRGTKPRIIRRTNLDTGVHTDITVTFAAPLVDNNAAWPTADQTNYWDVGSLTFVEPLNAYLVLIWRLGSPVELAWIDATTGLCSLATDIVGDFGPIYRTEGKIRYVPSMGAILHFTSADQNWGVIRIT